MREWFRRIVRPVMPRSSGARSRQLGARRTTAGVCPATTIAAYYRLPQWRELSRHFRTIAGWQSHRRAAETAVQVSRGHFSVVGCRAFRRKLMAFSVRQAEEATLVAPVLGQVLAKFQQARRAQRASSDRTLDRSIPSSVQRRQCQGPGLGEDCLCARRSHGGRFDAAACRSKGAIICCLGGQGPDLGQSRPHPDRQRATSKDLCWIGCGNFFRRRGISAMRSRRLISTQAVSTRRWDKHDRQRDHSRLSFHNVTKPAKAISKTQPTQRRKDNCRDWCKWIWDPCEHRTTCV